MHAFGKNAMKPNKRMKNVRFHLTIMFQKSPEIHPDDDFVKQPKVLKCQTCSIILTSMMVFMF